MLDGMRDDYNEFATETLQLTIKIASFDQFSIQIQ